MGPLFLSLIAYTITSQVAAEAVAPRAAVQLVPEASIPHTLANPEGCWHRDDEQTLTGVGGCKFDHESSVTSGRSLLQSRPPPKRSPPPPRPPPLQRQPPSPRTGSRNPNAAPFEPELDCTKAPYNARWTAAAERALKSTNYGGFWAIAITSGCNFGYATGRISMDQAQDAAVSACESVLSVKCRVIESGHNVCDNDKRLESMSNWAFASADYGQYYAAAIGWWCGRAYGRFGWDELQVNYLAANDCNRDSRREDGDLRAMSPCGVAAKGVAGCPDERKWAQAVRDARARTEPGRAWAVIVSKRCDVYTALDLGSVEEATDTGVFADCLDAARAEGLGDRGCGVVASGKAT